MVTNTVDEPRTSVTNSAGKLHPCPGCRRLLPIRLPQSGGPVAQWKCEDCHTQLAGVFVKETGGSYSERVRFAPSHFDCSRVEPVPAALRDLVAQFLIRRRAKQEFHERRRNPRVPCDLDAVVLGLDDHWLPCCGPYRAVVIDLAVHGLGMMTAERIAAAQLAIQIECPSGLVQLVGRNAWSNFVGDKFQNTGVEFVVRLGGTALHADEH
jgi:hypothetical protein